MTLYRALLAPLSIGLVGAAVACGSAFDSTAAFESADGGPRGSSGGSSSSGDNPSPTGAGPQLANAVILVHAASFPPFRVCFGNMPDDQPTPNRELMPSSNVVGVEVGAAVRLPPLAGGGTQNTPGTVRIYQEADIRGLYANGATGPDCKSLIEANPGLGLEIKPIETSLATGVHVLALMGCRPTSADPAASKARCGDTWTADKGNLALQPIELQPFGGGGTSSLPVRALLLSSSIAAAAQGKHVGISFGAVDTFGASVPSPFADRLALGELGAPSTINFTRSDPAVYAKQGFALSYGTASDAGVIDAGADASTPRQLVAKQSLAEVQSLSEPTAVPEDWYAPGRAGFVLLVLGDPDPRLPNGTADPDPTHAPHLLALPLESVQDSDAGTLPEAGR